MDSKRIPKSAPQTHRQSDQPATKRLALPGNQENLMRLQGMIGNQAVQRMIQRQIEMEEMEIPVESESSNPVVLDEMEVPVEGGADESGAITRPDGVVEFPPDHVPHPEGKEDGPATPKAPKDSTDDSGAKVGPDGTLEFPPDHVPSSDEGGSWLDKLPFF